MSGVWFQSIITGFHFIRLRFIYHSLLRCKTIPPILNSCDWHHRHCGDCSFYVWHRLETRELQLLLQPICI